LFAAVVDFGQSATVIFGQAGRADVIVQFLHFLSVEEHLEIKTAFIDLML